MNRRTFLETAGLSATAAVVPTMFATAAETPVRKMTLALTPGSIGVSAKAQSELNALAHRHGYESVEPRSEELASMTDAQVSEILNDLKEKDLVWAAAGLPVEFRKDDAKFREDLEKLPRIAAGLKRAGAARVGTWLSPSHDELTYVANFRQHAARLREVAKILENEGLRFGMEYVGTQSLLVGRRYSFLHTLAETRDLIAEIGGDNIGVVLDSWHWWTAGDTEADLLSLKNEDVVSVDLNDAPSGIPREAQLDNQRELPATTGVIDIAGFLSALQQIGYDGPVRPEPFNKALNDMEDEDACAAASEALHRAMGLIKKPQA